MKRTVALILSVLMLLSMTACGNNSAETPAPSTEPKKDYSAYAGIVADPKAWYDDFMALPIANANMTEDELRQLCVDAFKVNLSFQWTPTEDISYSFTLLERVSEVYMPKGIAYSGLFYNSNNARGNIWKVLQYYDPETGAVDMEELGSNHFMVLSSACAYGCQQAWNRVSNSCPMAEMTHYKLGQSNIVLVGPYTYIPSQYSFGHGDGTDRIIADNGAQTMCESYAAMKPADGVYSSSSWHVMMCSAKPEVVRGTDGRIDPLQSYMLICEQGAGGTKTNDLNYQQENGVVMRPLGTVDKKYTFQELMDRGYVPFTLKEFTGEDPVEPGEAWIGTQTARVESGKELTAAEIFTNQVWGNYNICTVEVQVKNPDGQVLLSYKAPPISRPDQFSMAFGSEASELDLNSLANGSNTIHVYAQLSNGELLEAYTSVLK